MKLHRWDGIPAEQMNELVTRQVIHADRVTVARLQLRRGALIARHSHSNEQISMVVAGALRFDFDDSDIVVRAGESLQIPGTVPHSVLAVEDSTAIDIFAPVREDWIRGEDAYLRGR